MVGGKGIRVRLLGSAWLVFLFLAGPASGEPVTLTTSEAAGVQYAGEMTIPLNKSQIIRVDHPFSNLFVGNPKIADVRPLTNRTIYVLGKAIGSTSLSIYTSNGETRPLAVVDINVTYDVDEIKRQLYEMTGGEPIQVRAIRDSVILSGQVSSANVVHRAMAIAKRFTAGADKVTNLMTVKGSQQVMLAVRFAEMKRSAAKELGVNLEASQSIGSATVGLLTGKMLTGLADLTSPALTGSSVLTGIPSPATALGRAGAIGTSPRTNVGVLFDALETKGIVKTLAEPNLIALSGDTATFLAGGEFPIPVAQANSTSGTGNTITIEFKQFGVSLAFTPTVLNDDLISLVVAPEVSSVDPTTSITLNNLVIPGLKTRRAKTTVELRDGQSFAIAGLIQSDYSNNINQYPFLGDLPILGALLRSPSFQHDQTELVIVVTPHLVKPVRPTALALPTDGFTEPSDRELFLNGQLQNSLGGKPVSPGGHVLGTTVGGGLDGRYGHIIE